MRHILKYRCKYSGPKWEKKVNKMSDSQVMAVYFRLDSVPGCLK